ncbi:MAG: LysM peptidoglycan-binding domain-containing protein [Mycobacterium sp.]
MMLVDQQIAPTICAPTLGTHGRVRVYRRGGVASGASVSRGGPARRRPGGAPLRHRGPAVPMSRAPHRPRPITPGTTFVLALVAAVITIWLGIVAQFGAATAGSAGAVPDQLGVVRVQSGESLQQLAARVAPDAPTAQVVDRIRKLNRLDSVALDAGQTLIAPIS